MGAATEQAAGTSRRYRSPRREEQARRTRAEILTAATTLFTSRGWAATGMRDVAVAAAVATETVYSHFPSKAVLLQRVMDQAVVGDDAPVSLAARPEFAALAAGSRTDRVAGAAELLTQVNRRTSGIAKVLREAAPSDPVIAAMLSATRERIRSDIAAGASAVLGRPPTRLERDGLWALASVEVYLLLVEESGWTVAQYRAWVTRMLDQALSGS